MILKKFDSLPDGYGEVAFFWWHGDDITREKLQWILNQLKGKHICGLQINYCHSDKGGLQYGLTMESNPRPFSDEWWELVGWFIPASNEPSSHACMDIWRLPRGSNTPLLAALQI